jgi:hypothetical protein
MGTRLTSVQKKIKKEERLTSPKHRGEMLRQKCKVAREVVGGPRGPIVIIVKNIVIVQARIA